jgi:hypothetical protein
MVFEAGRGLGDHRVHLAQDMQPGFPGLGQGLGQDLPGEAGHFDIHLQRSDAVLGAGHLEVHIPQGILISQDVREDGHLVPFLHEAHGYPGHRRLDGHAGVHQGQAGAAHRGHGGRAVAGQDLGDYADGVRELLTVGEDLGDGPFRQGPVPDLPPSRSPQEPGFPHRVGREIVMEHEGLEGLSKEAFDALLIRRRSQGRHCQGLGLTPGEQRRTVGAGEQVNLAGDGPYF